MFIKEVISEFNKGIFLMGSLIHAWLSLNNLFLKMVLSLVTVVICLQHF